MRVLALETSCDETAAAVVDENGKIFSSAVAYQMELHAEFGGVVPELASRQHLRSLPTVVASVLAQCPGGWEGVDGIAATYTPGLMGALLVGLTYAKGLALARSLPFIGVNHLEGHLLAAELEAPGIPRPFLGIVASGGHTSLYRVSEGPQYVRLAGTRDDAMGEAFDKVAKLLGLGYPGGPAIQKAAESGDAKRFRLKAGTLKDGSLGFSYSGIKTAVRYLIEELRPLGPLPVADIAASFQRTVVEDLVHKSLEIAKAQKVQAIDLSGGVAANRVLRQTFSEACPAAGLAFFSPPLRWCTDNAAMIGLVGARKLLQGQRSDFSLPAIPNLSRSDEWMESTPLAGSVISPGI